MGWASTKHLKHRQGGSKFRKQNRRNYLFCSLNCSVFPPANAGRPIVGIIYRDGKGEWRDVCTLTTKDLQLVLKKALNKTETSDFEHRLRINNYDSSQIVLFRRQYKNVKLMHIYYSLISRDFYTKEGCLGFA